MEFAGEIVEENDPLPYENGDERQTRNGNELTNINVIKDNGERKTATKDT